VGKKRKRKRRRVSPKESGDRTITRGAEKLVPTSWGRMQNRQQGVGKHLRGCPAEEAKDKKKKKTKKEEEEYNPAEQISYDVAAVWMISHGGD